MVLGERDERSLAVARESQSYKVRQPLLDVNALGAALGEPFAHWKP